MTILDRLFVPRLILCVTCGLSSWYPSTAIAKGVAIPYFSFGNGYGGVNGPNITITQRPNTPDLPVFTEALGCCPKGGYSFDLRLGVRLFKLVALEGGVIGQSWDVGTDDRGGTAFGGGGLRLYLLASMEEVIGDLNLPLELSIGSLFGYTIIGKDFAYSGSVAGFDTTLEWFATKSFAVAARLNLFASSYDNFVYTDYDGDRGRCLDGAGANIETNPIHKKGSMNCTGASPTATFFSPQLVLTFYLDVF